MRDARTSANNLWTTRRARKLASLHELGWIILDEHGAPITDWSGRKDAADADADAARLLVGHFLFVESEVDFGVADSAKHPPSKAPAERMRQALQRRLQAVHHGVHPARSTSEGRGGERDLLRSMARRACMSPCVFVDSCKKDVARDLRSAGPQLAFQFPEKRTSLLAMPMEPRLSRLRITVEKASAASPRE
jgi:hypothetical protein